LKASFNYPNVFPFRCAYVKYAKYAEDSEKRIFEMESKSCRRPCPSKRSRMPIFPHTFRGGVNQVNTNTWPVRIWGSFAWCFGPGPRW